jgi:glucokinase
MKDESRIVVGVDIGGTKVAAGLVNGNGEILARSKTPMLTAGPASNGLMAVTTAIRGLFPEASSLQQIAAIGICAPGPLDPETGVIINPPNLTIWHNYPLADEMRRTYKVPVKVDNDANAAALAEAKWGVVTETFFMRALAPGSAPELFLTAASIMGKPAPRLKVGTLGSTATVPFAIAGSEVALKRWPRVLLSPDERAKNLGRIRTPSSGEWPAETSRRSAARWWEGLMQQVIR